MYARSLAVQLLLAFCCAVLAAPALGEDGEIGTPPALEPGQRRPCPSPAR